MAKPEDARQVCIASLGGVLASYLLVGLLGYLAYGSGAQAPIIDSLPGDGFVGFNRFLMVLVVLATFPLQASLLGPNATSSDSSFRPGLPRL